VSYSAGQWGGVRAAHSLRPILSELGCVSVSSMVHIPKAQDVLDEHGALTEQDSTACDKWRKYTGRTWAQLQWWGEAARNHRLIINPLDSAVSPPLNKQPSERNAPS
jgi:chromate reductase, NAD(P)H dehydrogenase (quinone)